MKKAFCIFLAFFGLGSLFYGLILLVVDFALGKMRPDGYPVTIGLADVAIAFAGILLMMASGWISNWPEKRKNKYISFGQ